MITTKPRIVVDIHKCYGLRKALRIMALERDSSVRELILLAIAETYPAVRPMVIEELGSEAIAEKTPIQ